MMAITGSDELRHSPAARDTKSSPPVIAIIICSLNNILFCCQHLYLSLHCNYETFNETSFVVENLNKYLD
jgi:hypothetical protein